MKKKAFEKGVLERFPQLREAQGVFYFYPTGPILVGFTYSFSRHEAIYPSGLAVPLCDNPDLLHLGFSHRLLPAGGFIPIASRPVGDVILEFSAIIDRHWKVYSQLQDASAFCAYARKIPGLHNPIQLKGFVAALIMSREFNEAERYFQMVVKIFENFKQQDYSYEAYRIFIDGINGCGGVQRAADFLDSNVETSKVRWGII